MRSGVSCAGSGPKVMAQPGERTHAAENHRFHPKVGLRKLTFPLT